MEAAILQYAEAEAKKHGNFDKKPTPGVFGWIKDRALGFIFGSILLTVACIVQYFQ